MAKVVFLVGPSSTTKPTLANAGTGAIIQGRPDDVAVVTLVVRQATSNCTRDGSSAGVESLMHS